MQDEQRQWMIETLGFYRPLEFFRGTEELSLEELALSLARQYEQTWESPLETASVMAELELLALDESRVWWEDIEAGWEPGDGTWEWVLEGWSRISRGAFRPMEVEERWREGGSGVTLRFELQGRPVELRPRQWEGLLDLNLLYDLNLHLKSSGLRFERVAPFDETAYVLVLGGEEKSRMEARGWRFE